MPSANVDHIAAAGGKQVAGKVVAALWRWANTSPKRQGGRAGGQ